MGGGTGLAAGGEVTVMTAFGGGFTAMIFGGDFGGEGFGGVFGGVFAVCGFGCLGGGFAAVWGLAEVGAGRMTTGAGRRAYTDAIVSHFP